MLQVSIEPWSDSVKERSGETSLDARDQMTPTLGTDSQEATQNCQPKQSSIGFQSLAHRFNVEPVSHFPTLVVFSCLNLFNLEYQRFVVLFYHSFRSSNSGFVGKGTMSKLKGKLVKGFLLVFCLAKEQLFSILQCFIAVLSLCRT